MDPRAPIVLLAGIAAAGAVAWYVARTGPDEVPHPPASPPRVAGATPAADAARPVDARELVDAEAPAAPKVESKAWMPKADEGWTYDHAPGYAPRDPSEVVTARPKTHDFWRECVSKGDEAAIRACIREQLGGRSISPEELASMVCGDARPDAADKLLVYEVAAAWSPSDTAAGIERFQSRCTAPASVWSDFVSLQASRDPEWTRAFAESLAPSDVFGDRGIGALQSLAVLADLGDERLRAILDEGARGEPGASDAQVAYAIDRALSHRTSADAKLAFLGTVIDSPTFEGRHGEVDAVVRGALGAATGDAGHGATVALLTTMLSRPNVSHRTAERLVELDGFGRLPAWMAPADREALLSSARMRLAENG